MEALITNRIPFAQKALTANQAILLYQPLAPTRNHDVRYPFCPDRDVYYLSMLEEPDLWLLILANETIVFSPPSSEKSTLWEGELLAEKCTQNANIDHWHPIEHLESKLQEKLHQYNIKEVFTNTDKSEIKRLDITLKPVEPLIHAQRVCKDEHEIACIRKASQISALAHNYLIENASSFRNEIELEGAFFQFICQHHTRDLAYPSIVASAKNACTLHYTKNNAAIPSGSLILVDAGSQVQQYASDITRTFPQSGQFSRNQQAIYEAVLDTQMHCLSLLKPNVAWADIHQAACQRISEHLKELGYLEGSLDEIMQQKSYLQYFPHGIGHSLGLNVHDIPFKTLKPNMVVTVEPGIYIPQDEIGIRIEDVIRITEDGYENLSHAAVKSVQDIHKLCQS